jgi:hypothetical protein
MSEQEKPLWIRRDGVDVAVVISPELFEELVSAKEELEDSAAVDEAQKDKRPGIPWEQVKKNLGLENYLARQHTHQRFNRQQRRRVMAQIRPGIHDGVDLLDG